MNGLNMVSLWSPSSFRPPTKVSTTLPGLTDRENEVLDEIKRKVASLNMPVKFDLGKESDCGLTLQFMGTRKTNANGDAAFVLGKRFLSAMAEDKAAFHKHMARIDEMIQNEKMNRAAGVNVPQTSSAPSITEQKLERFLRSKEESDETCIMNILDRNRNNFSVFRTSNIQVRTATQMVSRYEQMLSVQ